MGEAPFEDVFVVKTLYLGRGLPSPLSDFVEIPDFEF
jgi:hypothetical protein